MNNFIYDLFSLTSKDINEWSNKFFWPISTNETQRILNDLLKIHTNNLNNEKDIFVKKCLITYNPFHNPYVIIFNYILLKERIKKKKIELEFSNNSRVMSYLHEETNQFPLKIETLKNHKKVNIFLKSSTDKIKTLIFNLVQRNCSLKDKIYVLDQEGILDKDLFERNNKWVEILSYERLKKEYKLLNISHKLKTRIEKLHKQYLSYSMQKLGINLSKRVRLDLLTYQKIYFKRIYSLLKCLSNNSNLKKIKKIYVGTANTTIRAISTIIRENNGTVYGFPHGSWICHSFSKRPLYNEFLIYDYFYVYTNSQKVLFYENLKKNSVNLPIKFISQNSKIFHEYKLRYQFKLPVKIKSIMIIECQLWCDDIRFELPETIIIYEFYHYVCSFLASLGYKIYFKKRPKSNSLNFSFFQNISNVEIINGELKDRKNLELADAIIFLYGLSSTFIPLICSNKKLIYFDCGWEKWNPKVYKVLKKRCDIVKTYNNSNNKIRFSKSMLIKSLNVSKKSSDNSFFDKFLSIYNEKK